MRSPPTAARLLLVRLRLQNPNDIARQAMGMMGTDQSGMLASERRGSLDGRGFRRLRVGSAGELGLPPGLPEGGG